MARRNGKGGSNKFISRAPKRVEAERKQSAQFASFTGEELRLAMERVWKNPKIGNPVNKARWKP